MQKDVTTFAQRVTVTRKHYCHAGGREYLSQRFSMNNPFSVRGCAVREKMCLITHHRKSRIQVLSLITSATTVTIPIELSV